MELLTRAGARKQNSPHYFTGRPCPQGHISPRFTSTGNCKECGAMHAANRYVHKTEAKRRRYSTPEELRTLLEEKHPQYDFSEMQYVKSDVNIKVNCPVHGAFFASPANLLAGRGCKRCGAESQKISTTKSTAQFISEAKSVWGNAYTYEYTKYTLDENKVLIGCCAHAGVFFEQRASSHLAGQQGCPNCNAERIRGKAKGVIDFIEESKAVWGSAYSYDLVNYINNKTPVEIRCNMHPEGTFFQRPSNHLLKIQSCPKCKDIGTKERAKAVTGDVVQFVFNAETVWGNAYNYEGVEYITSQIPVEIECKTHPGTKFLQRPNNHLSGYQGCPKCNHMKSSGEQEVGDFLEQYTTVERRNRTLIAPRELDIYLPEFKIGIEYHGLYWHTEPKVKDSHRTKWDAGQAAGIRVVQIFEDEWLNKQDIVKARLLAFIGQAERRYARKMQLKEISWAEAKALLTKTHIQGAGVSGNKRYGLFDGEQLVAVATFGKARSGAMTGACAEGVWEVLRYASVGRVVGGFSRLYRQFLKDINPTKVTSYCDLRYGTGELYKQCGFELEAITEPDYWWVPKGKVERVPRYAVQKHKLAKPTHPLHQYYLPGKTEKDICAEAGWERIMGVGNQRWVHNLS